MPSTVVVNLRDCPGNWESNPRFVYVGRGGRGHDGYFGNPFILEREHDRPAVLERYRVWIRLRLAEDPAFRDRVAELHGKYLVCFCRPLPCHGDILAEWADVLKCREDTQCPSP